MLSCWVSESSNRKQITSWSTTKSSEFYLIFLSLGFCLFQTSLVVRCFVTISVNCFEFHTEYQQVIALFFSPTHYLSLSLLKKTINISQAFQNGAWKKKALSWRNVLKGVIGTTLKLEEKIIFKRESILPLKSGNYSKLIQDIIFSVLWHCNGWQTSQNNFAVVSLACNWKKDFFSCRNEIRKDL